MDTSTKVKLVPTGIGSAVKIYAACVEDGTSNYVIAQSDGYVRRVTPSFTSPTLTDMFVLPAATFDNNSVEQPESITLENDVCLITTRHGTLYKYQFSTGTQLDRRNIWRCIANVDNNDYGTSFTVGKLTGGIVPIWGNNLYNPVVSLWDSRTTPMTFLGSATLPANTQSVTSQISSAKIDTTTKTMWVCWGLGQISIYDISEFFASTAKTKIVDASNNTIAGKIIRIPLITNRYVEYAANISAVETTIATNYTSTNYLEVAIAATGADARIFST
jgi:hypothetical protein